MCYQNCKYENRNGECVTKSPPCGVYVNCPNCDEEVDGLELEESKGTCPYCDTRIHVLS